MVALRLLGRQTDSGTGPTKGTLLPIPSGTLILTPLHLTSSADTVLQTDTWAMQPTPTTLESNGSKIMVAAIVAPIVLGFVILVALALWCGSRHRVYLSSRRHETRVVEPFSSTDRLRADIESHASGTQLPHQSEWASNVPVSQPERLVKVLDVDENDDDDDDSEQSEASPQVMAGRAHYRSFSRSTRATTLVAPSIIMSDATLVDPVRSHRLSGRSTIVAPRRARRKKSRRTAPPVAMPSDPLSRLEREKWLTRYRELEEEQGRLSPLDGNSVSSPHSARLPSLPPPVAAQ